ncbi:MAG TPA: hypothetical protein VL404_04125, partial [Candidatus Eisenbacteria bacterium]|nr:hypothetical protein [Candidatus Eisenbacteria bacterium]
MNEIRSIRTQRFSPALRLLSLLVAASFLLQDVTLAATPDLFSRDIAQNPTLLKVSPQFAEINEIHRGQRPRLIIHIQDAHTNLSGQENLANVLEELIRRYKLKTIFVEGGDKDNSLDFLRPLAPLEVRRRVAKKYLMKGELNGEEYLNLASDYEMDLWGVEQTDLYEKNLKTYAGVVEKRDRVIEYLEQAGKRLQSLKRQLFPKDIVAFDDFLGQFEKKEKDFTEYHRLLTETARRYGVRLEDYPDFVALEDLRAKEEKVDFQLANDEQERLILALFPDELSRAEARERLSARLDRIKSESHTPLSFYESLIEEAGKRGVPMKDYPNITRYVEYLKLYGRVNMERLLKENRQLEEEVYRRALTEKDAYYLHELSLHLANLKTLFSLQASKEDFQTYQERRRQARFQPMVFLAFLNSKLYDMGNAGDLLRFQALVDENIAEVEGFYNMTEERDDVFLRNAFKKMDEENVSAAVLITGGYHTPHLKELMKREGISYAVLTPNITEETNLKRYEEILLGQLGEDNPLLKKTRLVSGTKESDDSIRYTWARQNSPVASIVADFGQNPALFPALTARRPVAARLAGELRLSRAVYADASLVGNRSSAATVLEPAENARLTVRTWAERDSSPLTPEEARVFETERGRLTDPAAFTLTRAEIRSVKQSFYDRSSGVIRLRLVVEGKDGKKYFIELSGADTTSMDRLKQMMPSLAELEAPGAAFQISMINQGDLEGNFTLTSDGKAWKFFGASDEPWASKTHRALVESRDGRHAAGTIRLEGRADANEIQRVYFTPFGSDRETALNPADTEFVSAAYALVWGDTPSVELLRDNYSRRSDLRHVFRFPFLDGNILFYDQLSTSESRLADAYAGRPVDLDRRGLDAAALQKTLVDTYGYRLKASAAEVSAPGDFSVSGDAVRLVFLPARYPVNGVAVAADGKLAFVNIEGESGRRGADYWNLAGWLAGVLGWKPAAFFAFDNGKDPSWIEKRDGKSVPVFQGRNSANAALSILSGGARLAQSSDDVMRRISDGVDDLLRHPAIGEISVGAIITYYLPSSQSRSLLPVLRPRVEALLVAKGFLATADPDVYRIPAPNAGEDITANPPADRGARLATVETIMTRITADLDRFSGRFMMDEVSVTGMMGFYAPESASFRGNDREILKARIQSLLAARGFTPTGDPDLYRVPGAKPAGARLSLQEAIRATSAVVAEQTALSEDDLRQAMALEPMAFFLYRRTLLESVGKAIETYAVSGDAANLRRVVLGAYARLQYGEILEYADTGEAFNAVTDRSMAESFYGTTLRAGDRDYADEFYRSLGRLRDAVAPGPMDPVEVARAVAGQALSAIAAFQTDFSVGAERFVDTNRIGFDLDEFGRFTGVLSRFEDALMNFFTNTDSADAVRYLALLGQAIDTFNQDVAPFYAGIARDNALGTSTIVQFSHSLQITWTLAAMAGNRLERGPDGARLAD